MRVLNRLEKVGETLRYALNNLAVVAPEWLQAISPPAWYDRYGSRIENYHFPKSDTARETLEKTMGADGFALLQAIDKTVEMPFLKEVPAVKTEPRLLMLQTREEYEALHAARRRQQTPEFKAAYAARSGIEGTH